MKPWPLRGMIAVVALLTLTLSACPKPASPDSRGTGTQSGAGGDTRQPATRSYTIKFDRPVRVGGRYKVVATGNMDQVATLNGKPMPSQTHSMEYSCEVEVTVKALHASSKATRLELKILKLQVTKAGTTKHLLPAGTVVLAKAVGTKEHFSVNGKVVAKPVAKVLEDLVNLYDGDTTTTDEVFGPGGPRKPGDTWEGNAAKMLASLKTKLKDAALWPKAGEVHSKVTFLGLKKLLGKDALELKVENRIENIAPSLGPVKATSGTLAFTVSGLLPMDTKVVGPATMHRTMTWTMEGAFTQNGQRFVLAMNLVNNFRATTTPLP